jgi:hypothetical protein
VNALHLNKRVLIALSIVLSPWNAQGRGVSPYLPLSLSPQIERQIERVLILAGKPVMTRPIAAAAVLDALPEACAIDHVLCAEVRHYLDAFMRTAAVTSAEAEVAITTGDSDASLPNRRGEPIDSSWNASASAYWQISDHAIVNLGGVAYPGEATPTGSFLSLGFDFAQLDLGFRDHWLSPLEDSSSLISSNAATMPSITLSNYKPLTRLGITYEVFAAKMSHQEGIPYFETTTAGSPRLGGFHIAMEPVSGFALSLNRETQYGGGARSSGSEWSDFRHAMTNTTNQPDQAGVSQETGNRVASLASSILFPGKIPFAIRAEYAGEDNAYAGNRLLGATNFSLGLDFPQLWRRFDFTFELSEWQNDWYVHHLYPEGLTNHGNVIGHWFGDERALGDAIGGWSQMLRAGWQGYRGQYWQLTYRSMENDTDWRRTPRPDISYDRMQMLSLSWSSTLRGWPVRAGLDVGKDVFGESFGRLSAALDFAGRRGENGTYADDDPDNANVDLFVDAGANEASVRKFLDSSLPNVTTDWAANPHFAVGVRRAVSARQDLGARIELDRIDGYELVSFRALDYRYRWGKKLGLTAFMGVGRYDVRLPAYGYYWGAGLQYRDIVRKWDLSLDLRKHDKLGRDKTLLQGEPPISSDRTRIFFDIESVGLYLSRRL